MLAKKKLRILLITLLLIAAGLVSWWLWSNRSNRSEVEQSTQPEATEPAAYSDEWFVKLLQTAELPNLEPIENPPAITGNQEADNHIRELAEKRGYRLRSLPTVPLSDLEEVTVQPPVVEAWGQLKAAALAENGISLTIISGYRSIETQRSIFLNQLDLGARDKIGRPYTNAEVAAGRADEVIDKVLSEYSIPGYSQHHTGYSLDIEDTSSGKPFEQFAQTKGFEWLSKNQYENARRFGFVPGYPQGASNLGPDAEPWELVWVGTENLQP